MKRKICLDDFYRIMHLNDAQISPDGKNIVFVKSYMDKESDFNKSEIWLIDENKELTCLQNVGRLNDSPRWSPDGNSIMFLSTRNRNKELFIFNFSDNSLKMCISMPLGVAFPQWSPDGQRIAFFSSEDHAEPTLARYVTRAKQFDDVSMTQINEDRKKHLYVYELATDKITKIISDDFRIEDPELGSVGRPSWSSDSQKLTFVGKMQDLYEAEFKAYKADIYVTDLNGNVKGLRDFDGMGGSPVWSKDDKSIIFLGHLEEFSHATSTKVCKIDIATRKFDVLTQEADLHTAYTTINDSASWLSGSDASPKLSEDGKSIYFIAAERGCSKIFNVNIETKKVKCIVDGKRNIYSFTIAQGKIVYCFTSLETPSEIGIFDLTSQKDEIITSINKDLLDEIELAKQIHFEYKVGSYTTDGWISIPNGLKKGETCPTILSIHGGPYMQYGWAFTFENELFAAMGLAVAYTNPRGSRGYTEQFGYELRGHIARPAYEDLMKFMDIVSTFDYADENKFVVTGQSYGGFMTNWIITQTNRFKAAIPQSSVSNWMTMCGMADMGYMTRRLLLSDDNKELIHLWEMSPLAHVKNVKTPTLVMQCENDYRCPMEQAQQFYTAMKWNGCDTRMLRFPNSNHGMLRNGKPSLRIFRLQEMVKFFKEYV